MRWMSQKPRRARGALTTTPAWRRSKTLPSGLLGLLALGLAQGGCQGGGSAPRAPVAAISAQRVPGKAPPASSPTESSLTKVMDLPKGTHATLSTLRGALLVTGLSGFFAVIEGDEVVVRPDLERGLPPDEDTEEDPDRGTIHRVVGRWPDAVWLVWRSLDTWSTEANLWHDRIFRLQEGRWQKARAPELDHVYQALWEQGAGCLVGLLTSPGSDNSVMFAESDIVDCPGKPSPPLAQVNEEIFSFEVAGALGFASGELMMLLEDSLDARNGVVGPRLVVLKSSPPSRVDVPLPIPPEIEQRGEPFVTLAAEIFGNSPSEVYVVGNYALKEEALRGRSGSPGKWLPLLLWRFDGSSFSPLPAPPLQNIWRSSLGDDGSLALLGTAAGSDPADPDIWLLPPGGKWQELTMPPVSEAGMQYTPIRLAARSATDVWVVGEAKNRQQALFHTRPRRPSSGAEQASP